MRVREKVWKLAEEAVKLSKVIDSEKGLTRIVTHYDADGISSGAILYKLMQYLGKDFEIVFIKQLEGPTLQKLVDEKEPASLWIFADMGSGNLELLKKYLEHNKVLIIDHHQPQKIMWPNLLHFNPYLIGIQGEDEISSSGMSYLIARTLSIRVRNLVHLALVGAVGDMQKKTGSFKGINFLLQEDAELIGTIKVQKGLKLFGRYTKPLHKALEFNTDYYIGGLSGNESACIQFLSDLGITLKNSSNSWKSLSELSKKEEQKLITSLLLEGAPKEIIGKLYKLPNNFELGEFASILNACGKIGKPLEGVKLCLGGHVDIDSILLQYRKKLGESVQWYHNNKNSFMKTKNATYIIAKNEVDDTHIGVILSIALKSGTIKTDVAFAFANASNGVKVSARTKDSQKNVNLGAIIAKVTSELTANGMPSQGGGHRAAAGGKIPFGTEEKFIEMVEKELN